MRFIGGSRHGLEVPLSVQMAIHAQRKRWIEVDPQGTAPPGAAVGWSSPARERYHVVMCRAGDGGSAPMLVRSGLGRQALQSLAAGGGASWIDALGQQIPQPR